ncbi:MAG: hypothetical protein WC807_00155 [Hyphomicrobium sp.]|jgi:hypothetical protein
MAVPEFGHVVLGYGPIAFQVRKPFLKEGPFGFAQLVGFIFDAGDFLKDELA